MLNSDVNSAMDTVKSNGKAKENTSLRSGQSVPWAALSSMHQDSTASAEAAFNAEAFLDNMNLLSLKDPTKTSHANKKMELTSQGSFPKSSTGESSVLFALSLPLSRTLCCVQCYRGYLNLTVAFMLILELGDMGR